MRSGRRLLALAALGAVGLLAALSISTSLALFSSTGGQQINSFAAGTVTLWSCSGSACTSTVATTASASTCTPTESTPCEYTIEYTGSLPAWIGLSVSAPELSSQQFSVTDSAYPGARYGVGPYPDGAFQVVGGAAQANGFEDTFTIQLATVSNKTWHNSSCHGTDDVGSDHSGSCRATGSVTLSAQAVQAENNSSTSLVGPEQWS
jgi:hypothetical protein